MKQSKMEAMLKKLFGRFYLYGSIILVVLGFFILFSGFHPIAFITGEWKTFTSTVFDFSVSYPGIWDAHQYTVGGYRGDETIIFRITSNSYANFYGIVVSRQVATNPTLEEVVTWGGKLRRDDGWRINRRSPGYEASELQQIMIDGQPLLSRVYRDTQGDALDEDVYIARENDMIIITLRTTQDEYDNFVDEFDTIVASFTPKE